MAAKKLRLMAFEAEDVSIISAACQDALFLAKDINYLQKSRRFSFLAQRFCNEDTSQNRRVTALLAFEGVLGVSARGINPQSNVPQSILSIAFIADKEPPSGKIIIELAGGGQIQLIVECIEIVLGDIFEARGAKSRPDHGDA